jgi:protein-S-isoprenylcysteine O-methyltransferase Ste14
MNPWLGKIAILTGLVILIGMRIPHARRGRKVTVAERRTSIQETAFHVLLGIGYITGVLLPLLFIATPLLSFADYPLRRWAFASGLALLGSGLWLFRRSHAGLGTNWSVNLELREDHQLVTSGIYKYIRNPMYAALLLYAVAQTLLLSNWIAGPCFLVQFTLMFILRLRGEERMMSEKFGQAYKEYARRTKRLIPGIW